MKQWFKSAAVLCLTTVLAACAVPDRQPQLEEIQSNIDATYEGEFGALLYNMVQAGEKAEQAADAKAHLESDPPYLANHAGMLEDAVTTSEEALAHRQAAEEALDRYLDPLRARIAYLEALHVPDISGMFSLPIFFDTGSASVKASEIGKIAEAADLLSQYPIAAVSIIGYTDTVGTSTANDDLARRRADAVVAALRDAGVPVASSVAVMAAGEAIGADQVDDPMNRRVDILITPHGAAAP